jgi:hypothetical protein
VETRSRLIDTFQIVGFAVSTGVAMALVVVQVDPMESMIIGLMLAILTQLFDMQLRHSSSEERILEASALSQSLYRDPSLLSKVREMVEDYYAIRDGWFDLFKLRAEDALSECHSILRSIAAGTMVPPAGGQFSLSSTRFQYAQTSAKQVIDFAGIKDAVEGVRDWYTQLVEEASARGVVMTTVIILSRDELKEALAQVQRGGQTPVPADTYFAVSDELPADLDENYMIVDDRVVGFLERRADGTFGKETVSTVPVEVERMVKRFDRVLRYAKRPEEVFGRANSHSAEDTSTR